MFMKPKPVYEEAGSCSGWMLVQEERLILLISLMSRPTTLQRPTPHPTMGNQCCLAAPTSLDSLWFRSRWSNGEGLRVLQAGSHSMVLRRLASGEEPLVTFSVHRMRTTTGYKNHTQRPQSSRASLYRPTSKLVAQSFLKPRELNHDPWMQARGLLRIPRHHSFQEPSIASGAGGPVSFQAFSRSYRATVGDHRALPPSSMVYPSVDWGCQLTSPKNSFSKYRLRQSKRT